MADQTTPVLKILRGNVGIGTASPTSPFHVAGTTNDGNSLGQFFQSGTGRGLHVSRAVASATRQLVSFTQLSATGGSSPVVHIQQADTGETALAISTDGATENFTVSDVGEVYAADKVGIGTASPAQKLHVSGSTLIANNNYHYGYTAAVAQATLIGITDSNNLIVGQNNANFAHAYIYGGTGDINLNPVGDVKVNSADLFVDGNLGVGTTSADVELHINDASGLAAIRLTGGAASADSFQIMQGVTGVTNAGFSIYDVDATATRLVIDTSGNVGIGTTSPGTLLHVYQDSSSSLEVLFENDGAGQSGLTLRSDRSSNGNLIGFVYFDGNDNGSNNTRYNSIESYIVDSSNGTEDGRLTTSSFVDGTDTEILHVMGYGGEGRVGINTTTPGSRLHVDGDMRIGDGNKIYLYAANDVNYLTYNKWEVNTSTALAINNAGTGGFQIQDAGTAVLFVGTDYTYGGYVGLGTTSPTTT